MKSNIILKDQIIFHIPHSSLNVPNYFLEKLTIPLNKFNELNQIITDLKVDKLVENIRVSKAIFKYSRMFCDVERFEDENLEPMAKKGMGIVYTKDINEQTFIKVDQEYKNNIIKKHYKPHHEQLNKLTKSILNKYNKAYIFDLHSFSDELVKLTFGYDTTPDICIGVDKLFEDEELTQFTLSFFKSNGYSVEINYPYLGTLIPNNYYFNKDSSVKGIMIEINKRIYLNNNFELFKKILEEYFDILIKK